MSTGPGLTIKECKARLKCGKTKINELIASGTLVKGKRVGRETVITLASVEKLERQLGWTPRAPTAKPRSLKGAAGAYVPSGDFKAEVKALTAHLFTSD